MTLPIVDLMQRLSLALLLLVAALCAACDQHGERVTVEAEPFTILREQHTYSNWNTGGTTTYYSVDVRYNKHEFHFPEFSFYRDGGASATDMTSNRIGYAYIISKSPAALLVAAGDLNNDASWYLLVDTPSGLHSEHVAFYASYGGLEWLDGDAPVPIANRRELLTIEGGKWLLVASESILDLASLHVYHLPSYDGSRGGALFVTLSPDRRKMARYDSSFTYRDDRRIWRPVIIENDIASGQIRSFDIDDKTMWFDTSEDIDRVWLESYFEWRKNIDASFSLQLLANPKPRPYHGRLEVETGTNGLHYRVPRLHYEHRKAAMDFIAAALGKTYAIEDLELGSEEPNATASANGDAAPHTDALSPSSFGPLASVDIDVEGKRLTIYFSKEGLSIENHDSALNEVVQKIATKLEAEFLTPRGQTWTAYERHNET